MNNEIDEKLFQSESQARVKQMMADAQFRAQREGWAVVESVVEPVVLEYGFTTWSGYLKCTRPIKMSDFMTASELRYHARTTGILPPTETPPSS